MNLKRKLLLTLCLALSGCVIYSPTYLNRTIFVQNEEIIKNDRHDQRIFNTTTSSTIRETVKESPLKTCSEFTLPRKGAIPDAPHALLELAASQQEIDVILADYVKLLKSHISSERTKLEQAHKLWLDSCR